MNFSRSCSICDREIIYTTQKSYRQAVKNNSTCRRHHRVTDREISFLSNIKKTDTCWEWTGGHDKKGYGRFWSGTDKGQIQATHYAWFRETGKWPEEFILHKCDNPPCVKFDHLFEGNAKSNSRDMWQKGRGFTPTIGLTITHCPRNHKYDENNLSIGSNGKRFCRSCKRERSREWRIKRDEQSASNC